MIALVARSDALGSHRPVNFPGSQPEQRSKLQELDLPGSSLKNGFGFSRVIEGRARFCTKATVDHSSVCFDYLGTTLRRKKSKSNGPH